MMFMYTVMERLVDFFKHMFLILFRSRCCNRFFNLVPSLAFCYRAMGLFALLCIVVFEVCNFYRERISNEMN